MAVDLTQGPIRADDPQYQRLLQNLQGNILKGHGRDYTVHIPLIFTTTGPHLRSWVRDFTSQYVTSAWQQQQATGGYHQDRHAGALFGNFFLSATGYAALGFAEPQLHDMFPEVEPTPMDRRLTFARGMAAQRTLLNDPPTTHWEQAYRGKIDAMITLAHDHLAYLQRQANDVCSLVTPIAQVLTVEHGHVLPNRHHDLLEPFGTLDSRSQPFFLAEHPEGIALPLAPTRWHTPAPLELVLLPDHLAPPENDCYGSYCVFRKLEQDICGFRQRLYELTAALGVSTGQAEAMLLGQCPTSLRPSLATMPAAAPDQARQGSDACTTPGQHLPQGVELPPREPWQGMVRRSVPYGTPHTAVPGEHSGVGLLFMSFQRSLSRQFGFQHLMWARCQYQEAQRYTGFGPHMRGMAQRWSASQPMSSQFLQRIALHHFVKMRGGEFFFTPSLPFLQAL